MRRFIYGAAYYEEYATQDRLEYDLDLMDQAGINTIRIAESTWSVEEPSPGVFDFSHVIRVIEAAAEHGIDVIVGTPTYAVPTWLADLDPGVLNGNGYGPRQNMDFTDPTFRFYAERIIRELVSQTAGYRNVIGFQIDNETKHYWVHSKQVIDGFREWLSKRFDSVEEVNKAYGLFHWSNSAASFGSLPDPTASVNASYIGAFEEYRRELATDYLAWQAGIVREYARDDQFVTHNFDYEWHELSKPGQQMGYSDGLQPDLNCFEVARSLDIAGTDIYFKPADEFTGLEIAFGGDLIRPLKHSPYLLLESQAQAFTGWLPYPGQVRLMAYSHIASGAGGVCYWPWMSIHNSIESYWKGVISHDGEPGFTYEEVCRIGNEIKANTELFSTFRKSNRVAMIVSPESLHALRHLPTDYDLSYNDVVREYYRALYELNLECDILYDREQDWSGYDLIVFPELYSADDAIIARVREFVKAGGTVAASIRSFFADENLAIRDDRQPHGLNDVFGMHYSHFTKDRTS
ncbi:MAG: beta-galactosidase, partial [Mogibacterium sp.]|nr:beta-galactosidase [Mogibacterium sp.]